jgi:hypothetical protein
MNARKANPSRASHTGSCSRETRSISTFLAEKQAPEAAVDNANLPDPGVLALEIAEELEAALTQFATIAKDLKD